MLFQQTKTGLALLYDEHTSNTYDVRLKLMKELLIIQKQDVVCVSGGDSHLNVSTESLPSTQTHSSLRITVSRMRVFCWQITEQDALDKFSLHLTSLSSCTRHFIVSWDASSSSSSDAVKTQSQSLNVYNARWRTQYSHNQHH